MPGRSVLLVAAVLGTLVALTGCALALVVGLVVAGLVPDGGSVLPGFIEGLVAGGVVLALTVPVTIAVLRWWANRQATVKLDWGWATLAVVAGLMATVVVWTLAGLAEEVVGRTGTNALLVLAVAVAPVAGYRVLLTWTARAPSPGSGSPPDPARP